MSAHTAELVKMALDCGALRLDGPFRLKSGDLSPYFFDIGRFFTGKLFRELAQAYARTIIRVISWDPPPLLFGPAYKGIPLAAACAMELACLYDMDAGFLFDRKEAKRHGEHREGRESSPGEEARQRLVGPPLRGGERIVLLDDVITTAGTKYQACRLLGEAAPQVRIEALVVALDRQEAEASGRTASEVFTESSGIPVYSIVTASEMIAILKEEGAADSEVIAALERHLTGRYHEH